ncbi:HVA22-like protein k isoform X2 [Durio zibethinus]|uniref:HVA22-like protein n=1 Tax=Durio zibethinus TaxID=66656 RepID=A0A6P5ZGA6_DURZI|nr:HVA22-like protein k isoform X2 [Durio zibethinus]
MMQMSSKSGLHIGQLMDLSPLLKHSLTNFFPGNIFMCVNCLIFHYASFYMTCYIIQYLFASHRFPYYYHFKFAFLVWLQLPSTEGAKQIYKNHLRPFLLKHQAGVDQLMGFACAEMARFISTRPEEYQFVRTMLKKIRGSARPKVSEPKGLRAISGQTRMISNPESDHD